MASEPKPGELPVFDTATKLAFDAIITTTMTNIVVVVPLIKVPGIYFISKQVVTWVLMLAWFPLTTFAAFFIIDGDRAARTSAYNEAKDELDEAIKDKPLDSEEVKKAHEEFKKKLGNLIRIKPVR